MVDNSWSYYNLYTRMRILEREYYTLRQSSRPIRLADYPTGSDHDMEILV